MWKTFWRAFRSWLNSLMDQNEEERRATARESRPPC